ncbi:hypothetical protein HUU05_21780 [candidate division KSB1 bacterium]|nr:hypothetical protein [candidate division KSB1 bacterium]
MKFSLFCLFALFLLSSCSSQNSNRGAAWEKKVDPRLRAALQGEQIQTQTAQNWQVLLKCSAPLSAAQKQELAGLGARVQAEVGAIVTAVLPSRAVTEVAKLDYVIYLELSKDRKIQSQDKQP